MVIVPLNNYFLTTSTSINKQFFVFWLHCIGAVPVVFETFIWTGFALWWECHLSNGNPIYWHQFLQVLCVDWLLDGLSLTSPNSYSHWTNPHLHHSDLPLNMSPAGPHYSPPRTPTCPHPRVLFHNHHLVVLHHLLGHCHMQCLHFMITQEAQLLQLLL